MGIASVGAQSDSIDVGTPIGWRDRALIGLMVSSVARIGAALAMRVDDAFAQNRRVWVRLREKGGKRHERPAIARWRPTCTLISTKPGSARISRDGSFGRSAAAAGSSAAPPQANSDVMVRRRTLVGGIGTRIGSHGSRDTRITAYFKNGGTLDNAAAMFRSEAAKTAYGESPLAGELRGEILRLVDETMRVEAHPFAAAPDGGTDPA